MSDLAFRKHATGLSFAVLIGLCAVVVHANINSTRRGKLEVWTENTAVGDLQYYAPGEGAPPLTLNRQTLAPVSAKPYDPRESRMQRVAEDDGKQFRLYQFAGREPLEKHPDDAERAGEPTYFVKVGPNEFLKLQASRGNPAR